MPALAMARPPCVPPTGASTARRTPRMPINRSAIPMPIRCCLRTSPPRAPISTIVTSATRCCGTSIFYRRWPPGAPRGSALTSRWRSHGRGFSQALGNSSIPDDIAKIGPGDRFLLNATGEEIAVRLGTQRSTVKPGHSVILHPPQPAPADRRIEVEMVRRVGSAWVPFNSTYWPLDPTARSFVLVHPDPVTGTPRVRNLSEVP